MEQWGWRKGQDVPKIVNEAERKVSIAKAVWFISAEHGLHAATVRAVAAQCGLSVGAIQHSFSSQSSLQQYAMALLVEQAKSRIHVVAQADGALGDEGAGDVSDTGSSDVMSCNAALSSGRLETIALLLEQLLPLDEERRQEARVWAMFTNEALVDDDLREYAIEMSSLMEQFCRSCLEYLYACGLVQHDVDLSIEAIALQSLLDGLTLRLLASPTSSTACVARQTLRYYLQHLCVQ